MLRQRDPRVHCEDHLKFIRQLPCVRCGDNTSTEAAHVRMPDPRSAKESCGKGEKPHDKWTLPLCGRCHRLQHDIGEKRFWDFGTQDPHFICMALWGETGKYEQGVKIINEWRL